MDEKSLLDVVNNPKADIVDGPFGSNLKSSDFVSAGVPVVKLQNIKENRFLEKNISYISKKKADELKRHSFRIGDIVITKLGAPLGVACIMPENFKEGVIVADLIRIRPDLKKVDPKYLCYQINSSKIASQFRELTKGTTRPRVNLTLVRQIKGIFPELSKQKQIVSKIESLFSEIDSGTKELENAKQKLELFRQSIFNAAIKGKLVPQDPNDEPASKLLERIRAEKEALIKAGKIKKEKPLPPIDPDEVPFDLPIGWKWVRVNEVCISIADCPHSTPKWTDTGEICLRTTNFRPFNLDLKKVRRVSCKTYNERSKRIELAAGDVLYSREGGILGIACRVPNDVKVCMGQRMMLLRSGKQALLPSYLELFLNSPHVNQMVKALTGGSAAPHLNVAEVRNFCLPLPPINEQIRIIQSVEESLPTTLEFNSMLNRNLIGSNNLKQSILKKAFEGELV